MGLDYSLELTTELDPARVLGLLAARLDLAWGDASHLIGPAIWISAIRPTPLSRSILAEAFLFVPDLSVGFRLNTNSADYEAGTRLMLRSTMLLLEQAGRSGVLLANGEVIVLLWTNGELVLNEAWSWSGESRPEDEITFPHERRPLPSPLL